MQTARMQAVAYSSCADSPSTRGAPTVMSKELGLCNEPLCSACGRDPGHVGLLREHNHTHGTSSCVQFVCFEGMTPISFNGVREIEHSSWIWWDGAKLWQTAR